MLVRLCSVLVLITALLLVGCAPTPEPTRLVAEPTTTPTLAASAPATPTALLAPTVAASEAYPAPAPVTESGAAYPGPKPTSAPVAPQTSAGQAMTSQIVVPTPSAGLATVTGVILVDQGGGKSAPLHYARVFLARRLKDDKGQPSFMVSMSKSSAPSSITDGDGRFAFGEVPPENYALIIETGQKLDLARNLSDGLDVGVVAEADQLLDIGEILIKGK